MAPQPPDARAIILAAGLGTRMKSALPKAAHPIAGRPMLRHLLASAEDVFAGITVVVGPDMAVLEKLAAPHATAVQTERLGTAHAALCAADEFGDGEVAILFADNPLISPATLRRLLDERRASGAGLALMAMRPADPARYGRLVTERYAGRSRRDPHCRMGRRLARGTRHRPVQRRRAVRRGGALAGLAARDQARQRQAASTI